MKAFVLDNYGKNEPLHLRDVPEPTLQATDVLIQVRAASLNQLDAKIRDGEFKLLLPYQLPLILGHDVAGVVLQVGAAVRRFRVGDEVYARPADFRIGTLAERIAVPEHDVALKPATSSMEEAASIPLVGLTAWQALVEQGRLQRGQRVFIQAGAGGVGTVAIQLAKYLGATVATTASAASAALVKGLGADIVIDYQHADFEARLHDYDLVLNSQNAKTLAKSVRIVKPGGQVISISGPPTPAFARAAHLPWYIQLATRLLSYRVRRQAARRGVDFSFLFMRANGQQLTQLTELIDAGKIRPVIDQVFPFAQTEQALAYVASGRAKGKVVITMA